jgi:hypothetical protein
LPFLFLIIISCSNEKLNRTISSDLDSSNFIEGRITTIGNEPFTYLGLSVNDSAVYILDCDKQLEETLKKNQGELYKVTFNEKNKTADGIKINVLYVDKIEK